VGPSQTELAAVADGVPERSTVYLNYVMRNSTNIAVDASSYGMLASVWACSETTYIKRPQQQEHEADF